MTAFRPILQSVSVVMRAHHFIIATAAALLLTATTGYAQSLADVARKEEERRKANPEATKVYTNKDLNAAPAPSTPAPSTPAGGTKDTKDTKDTKAKDRTIRRRRTTRRKTRTGRNPPRTRRTGRGVSRRCRINWIRTRLSSRPFRRASTRSRTDFVNRDDPAQRAVIERDRQKALAELDRLKKAVVDGKKAIADLEEEARRAGVPPGWLR